MKAIPPARLQAAIGETILLRSRFFGSRLAGGAWTRPKDDRHFMARKRQKLGEILQEWGTVTAKQIEQALGIAKGSGKRIGEALVEAGFCKEDDVAKALGAQFDMEYVDLGAAEVTSKIDMSLMPDELSKKHLVLPMGKSGGRLKLVIYDPMDLELLDLLRFRLNTEIETAIAPRSEIKNFIDGASSGGDADQMFSEESLVTESVDVTVDRSVDSSVERASDIHVEPMRTASCCATASTACATSATTCPSACRRRSSPASNSWRA
jgi:hypothetical protein